MACFEGILPVDKPAGFTSFDVIAKLRGMTLTRKLGHAGTLDPMATGVLPVFFGRAAKAVDLLPNHDKTYEAELKLGITTTTYDTTGETLETKAFGHVSAIDIENALAAFIGEQEQTPPMYSAVKVGGRKLCELARKGKEIERPARKITVYGAELLTANEPEGLYSFRLSCSRGTYIRSICHELGQRLGCGAAMSALRRTVACGFALAECVTLEEAQRLTDECTLEQRLLPVESAFASLPRFVLSEPQATRFLNGLELALGQFRQAPLQGIRLFVTDVKGRFLGLAEADRQYLRIIKLFALGENR
jgi:tRNA pseudouridine55 synthase